MPKTAPNVQPAKSAAAAKKGPKSPPQKRQRSSSSTDGAGTSKTSKASKVAKSDRDMFESYGRLDIHKVMIEDFPRTDAYRRAIVAGRAKHFKGKAVLDVGCGLGILSMLAARDGEARVVYAVEACKETAARAERIVAENGLSDRVHVIHGVMEQVKLPEKVDVVISEWMGYFLVHESMLESVLQARDRWLKPAGCMYPSRAQLFLCPGNFQKQLDEGAGFWKGDVYGFDFACLVEEAEAEVRAQPMASGTFTEDQLTQGVAPVMVADLDLGTCTKAMVRNIRSAYSFVLPDRKKAPETVHGMALWFDVLFPASKVKLQTGPHHPKTHWGQTLALMDEPFDLEPGEDLSGTMRLKSNKDNHRFYDVSFS